MMAIKPNIRSIFPWIGLVILATLTAAFLYVLTNVVIWADFSEVNLPVLDVIESDPDLSTHKNIPTRVRVIRVIDGDTIEIEGGLKVRYIGIDTPETKDPGEPESCYGHEAYIRNKELVSDKLVSLEKDVSETDRYGRLLRYIYVDDQMINKQLVREGYAEAISYPPDVKYQDLLRKAEKSAQQNKLGLWGDACN